MLVEGSLELDLAVHSEYISPNRIAARTLRLIRDGHKVLLVYNNAWKLWTTVAHEAWMRGENHFLIDALDPYEARFTGVSLQQLVMARIAYLSRLPAEHAEYEKIALDKKEVSRRALIASALIGASLAAVEKPVKSSLCNVRGVDMLCQACLEECGHGSCSAAICPIELLLVPSYSREALLDYIRILQPRSPGYAVFASRWAISQILQRLRELEGNYTHRIYFIPLNCPYIVGLEELLAVRALGLEPLIISSEEAHRDPYCAESREPYTEKVLRDYKEITREEACILRPSEAIGELTKPPSKEPLSQPQDILNKSLRILALKETERDTHRAPIETRTILIGKIEIDSDRCTLCNACVKACPTNALKLLQTQEKESILFKPANCIACNYCAEICPENAIKTRRQLPKDPYTWITLVEDENGHCLACGKPLTPKKQLSSILIKLKGKGFNDETLIPILLCEECKIKYQLGLITIDKNYAKTKIKEFTT